MLRNTQYLILSKKGKMKKQPTFLVDKYKKNFDRWYYSKWCSYVSEMVSFSHLLFRNEDDANPGFKNNPAKLDHLH